MYYNVQNLYDYIFHRSQDIKKSSQKLFRTGRFFHISKFNLHIEIEGRYTRDKTMWPNIHSKIIFFKT